VILDKSFVILQVCKAHNNFKQWFFEGNFNVVEGNAL
jgi:hypothetical protein